MTISLIGILVEILGSFLTYNPVSEELMALNHWVGDS